MAEADPRPPAPAPTFADARRTEVIEGVAPGAIDLARLIARDRPVILKGAVADWPLVEAGRRGDAEAMAYLQRFDAGRPFLVYEGAPAIGGRFHYADGARTMNFTTAQVALPALLDRLAALAADLTAPALYVGSTDLDRYLPGFRAENDLHPADDSFARFPPLASIWIGNRTVAAAHHDQSNNAAACVVGRRRFMLFPPDQVTNLYPGPLDPTPGGQAVSMVDFAAPDLARHPRFADALAAAEVAELEPGDLLVYPALWWHQVEALAPFNVLVNYWWNAAPAFLDSPQTTLLHAMLSLRDRPDAEKRAWRAMFDHYIFGNGEAAAAHLPADARGVLAPLDADAARRLRAYLLHRLNR